MRDTIIFGVLLVLIGIISCKKDNEIKPNDSVVYDTIKPLEYFPAFPGSYWIYDNNDTLKVADQYEKYIYNSAGYTAPPDYDTLILPKLILNGIYNKPNEFAYVKEYSISQANGSDYRDPPFKTLLSLTEGSEFTIGGSYQNHAITGKTVKVDTVINIGATEYRNVIITIHFDVAFNMSPEDCAHVREYYAKDVGLIKRETRNYPVETEFVTEIELVDYKINK